MTKADLLEIMRNWAACWTATRYVTNHRSDDAAVIVGECTDLGWLVWLMGRQRRLGRFVRVCARKAKHWRTARDYQAYLNATKGEELAWYADDLALSARYAADDDELEYQKQLKALRRIARDWANGLPPEVA